MARKVQEKTLEVFVVVGTTSSNVHFTAPNKTKENSANLPLHIEATEVETKVTKTI